MMIIIADRSVSYSGRRSVGTRALAELGGSAIFHCDHPPEQRRGSFVSWKLCSVHCSRNGIK